MIRLILSTVVALILLMVTLTSASEILSNVSSLHFKALIQSESWRNNDPVISSFDELLFHGNTEKINRTLVRRFNRIDSDKDGSLSLNEFVVATREANYKVIQRENLNISRDEYMTAGATDNERLIWEGMDMDHSGSVSFVEYLNSNMWALHLKITFNSENCFHFQSRLEACGFSPQQMVPDLQPELSVQEAAVLVMAQCRTGLSALSNYDLENCVVQSPCEEVPHCFTNRLRPQQTIVESVDYQKLAPILAAKVAPLVKSMIASLIVDMILSSILPIILIGIGIFALSQFYIVISVIILFCLLFGVSNFLAAFAKFNAIRDYRNLNMPKYKYSGKFNITNEFLVSTDPKCEMFVYWPAGCHRPRPFKGIQTGESSSSSSQQTEMTPVVEGVPLDAQWCEKGGELFSTKACKALTGGLLFEKYSMSCGPMRFNCRPLCYKATLDSCANNYIYSNSSLILSRVVNDGEKTIKPVLFDPSRPDGYKWEVWDRRYVETLEECRLLCDRSVMQCKTFFLQVPTRLHSRMRCSLLRLQYSTGHPPPTAVVNGPPTAVVDGDGGGRIWPIQVQNIFDIVDEEGSLGKDGRPPQFVVGLRRS